MVWKHKKRKNDLIKIKYNIRENTIRVRLSKLKNLLIEVQEEIMEDI